MRRLRSEDGFGLLELLIAVLVVNVALLALVGAFAGGVVSLRRASRTSTAAALADTQLGLYRALTYGAIALDSSAVGATDSLYASDPALGGAPASSEVSTVCATPLPPQCDPSYTTLAADGGRYRVDTYVTTTAAAPGRMLKRVTVVVRGGADPGTTLAREASLFDAALG